MRQPRSARERLRAQFPCSTHSLRDEHGRRNRNRKPVIPRQFLHEFRANPPLSSAARKELRGSALTDRWALRMGFQGLLTPRSPGSFVQRAPLHMGALLLRNRRQPFTPEEAHAPGG